MNSPLISVITPCYNAESFLRETIASVFQQTYPNIELIVVDDGSTDRSREILLDARKQYSALTVLQQENQGPYPARNLALRHAKGEFIAFLDADDYWAQDCLEKLYHALNASNSDLSYCGWQNIVENGQNGPLYIPPDYTNNIFEYFLNGCPWPIHAALTKRKIIDEIGGFSTRCFSAMDYDFWIRISAITQNITLVPEVMAFYRWHSFGQISSIKWRQVLDSRRVRKDFVDQNPQLVAHIPNTKISEMVDGCVLKQAYTAFWKRDLISAQQLFRAIWKLGIWRFRDLLHIAASFLPKSLFIRLIGLADKGVS